jgi:hypothetical protein
LVVVLVVINIQTVLLDLVDQVAVVLGTQVLVDQVLLGKVILVVPLTAQHMYQVLVAVLVHLVVVVQVPQVLLGVLVYNTSARSTQVAVVVVVIQEQLVEMVVAEMVEAEIILVLGPMVLQILAVAVAEMVVKLPQHQVVQVL